MKRFSFILICSAIYLFTLSSCRSVKSGKGAGEEVDINLRSRTEYDLLPVGDRITYTIDISTPEGKQKLSNKTLKEAIALAETEAARKYNCDRLIDPRFDYLVRGKRILRITIDGRPGVYKTKDSHYDSRTRQEIDINVRR